MCLLTWTGASHRLRSTTCWWFCSLALQIMIRQSCPPRVSSFREKRCVVENEHTGDQMSKFYPKTMFVKPEHHMTLYTTARTSYDWRISSAVYPYNDSRPWDLKTMAFCFLCIRLMAWTRSGKSIYTTSHYLLWRSHFVIYSRWWSLHDDPFKQEERSMILCQDPWEM